MCLGNPTCNCADDGEDSRLGGQMTAQQWYVLHLQTAYIDRGKALDAALVERDRWRRAFYVLTIVISTFTTIALLR